MLRLDSLTVRFGGTPAVDGVSADLPEGEVLAVVGPSGCGKSTLLRAIAGLEDLAAGSVVIDGRPMDGVPTHRRGTAMMFQEGQLFAQQSVADNIGYALRLRKWSRAQRSQRVSELLGAVGLEGLEERKPDTLSGGQQQRVALARSLAAEPRLLLLDEPLSALDRSLRERLAGDLRHILTQTGTTAVLVTHDHDEAFSIADQLAVMFAGRFVQVGATRDVWRHPVNEEVARFLGYSTILRGDSADALLEAIGHSSGGHPVSATERVVALRRSATHVSPRGELEATANSVVSVTDATRVRVHISGIGDVEALADQGTDVREGDRLRVRIDPAGVASLPEVGD